MSAGFISWIIAMSIALAALGCANSTDRVETFIKETLTRFRDALVMIKSYVEWSQDGLVLRFVFNRFLLKNNTSIRFRKGK